MVELEEFLFFEGGLTSGTEILKTIVLTDYRNSLTSCQVRLDSFTNRVYPGYKIGKLDFRFKNAWISLLLAFWTLES